MPNPNVQFVIDRMREELNQVGQGLHQDIRRSTIGYVSTAHTALYRFVLKQLEAEGRPLDEAHHFIRHFVLPTTSTTTSVGVQDYNLPAAHARTLRLLYGNPLRLAHRLGNDEEALASLSRLYGASASRAVWMHRPGATQQFRIWVVPGRDGVPRDAQPYELWYLKQPTQFTLTTDLLDVPEEYTEGIIWKACALAVIRERKTSELFEALAQQAFSVVP